MTLIFRVVIGVLVVTTALMTSIPSQARRGHAPHAKVMTGYANFAVKRYEACSQALAAVKAENLPLSDESIERDMKECISTGKFPAPQDHEAVMEFAETRYTACEEQYYKWWLGSKAAINISHENVVGKMRRCMRTGVYDTDQLTDQPHE